MRGSCLRIRVVVQRLQTSIPHPQLSGRPGTRTRTTATAEAALPETIVTNADMSWKWTETVWKIMRIAPYGPAGCQADPVIAPGISLTIARYRDAINRATLTARRGGTP